MYPVEVAYLREPTSDYVRTAAEVVNNVHTHVGVDIVLALLGHTYLPRFQNGPGDILVFLTGREEIERCLEYLSETVPQQVLRCLNFLPQLTIGTAFRRIYQDLVLFRSIQDWGQLSNSRYSRRRSLERGR